MITSFNFIKCMFGEVCGGVDKGRAIVPVGLGLRCLGLVKVIMGNLRSLIEDIRFRYLGVSTTLRNLYE